MKSPLVSLFEEAVRRYGPKTAIVDHPDGLSARRTSYDDLMMRASQVASYIRQCGIAPQSFVTIEFPACMEFIAVQMGVWMARCVAVPMGPAFPDERKTFIRQHCGSVLHIDKEVYAEILTSAITPQATVIPDEFDSALLIYTSGSTGNPKGILHDHKSLMTGFDVYDMTSDDRLAVGVPPYFIVQIYYWRFLLGAEVHMVPAEVMRDVKKMAQYHREYGITIAFVSASVFPFYHCLTPTLRLVITGSDRVICRKLTSYVQDNTYGLSETVGPILHGPITELTENAALGVPPQGVEVAILDDDMNPVPQGQEGEICLKGYFCKGYFKDEEMTRALYRGGWLHTGDLGYQLPDGRIQFVNRKDWMVKVNGQRVEPGEVEAAMCDIRGINQAVVKGFDDNNGSKYLVGYYTVKSDFPPITTDEVRKALEQRLPSYMVPSFFVPMETFPLNANSKIDRKSLEAPQREDLTADYVAPTNEVEAALCEIMANVLRLPRVGIDDHFLHLGGDSIRMMQMQQLCADSEIELLHNATTAMIYQGATPREIAKRLSIVTRREKPQMDDFPLNDEQKYEYFYPCMQKEGVPCGNVPVLYQLDKHLDIHRLIEAIQTAFAAHRGLFTRFFLDANQQPRQKIVMEPLTIPIEQMTEEAFEAEKPKLLQPFHLLKDRLFRLRLFEVNGVYYLFMDIHHIIIDGTSLQILNRDINQAYSGQPVEAEEWSMGELAATDEPMRSSASFSPDPLIGCSWPKGDHDFLFLPLSIGLDEVETFCAQEGVSIGAFTTAAYMLLLGQYFGKNDLTIYSVYHGRQDARSRNTVGLLARHILVHARWEDGMLCRDFIRQVAKMRMESMECSHVSPRLEFLYQGEMRRGMAIDGHKLAEVPMTVRPVMAQGDGLFAHIYTQPQDNRLTMAWIYVQGWRDEAFLRRLAEAFTECMRGLMRARTVGEVPWREIAI